MRKPSPISISSPRETSTSRPSASAASASSTAAALLLTTSAASAPVSRAQDARDVVLPRAARAGAQVVLEVRVAARRPRRTRSSAASASGARPRFVWTMTPVALSTRRSRGAAGSASSVAKRVAQVPGLGAGADLLARALEHTPRRVDRERIVAPACELVDRGQIAQLHWASAFAGGRRDLGAAAVVALDHRLDCLVRIVGDVQKVEVVRRDHPVGEQLAPDPVEQVVPVVGVEEHDGEVQHLAGLDQRQRLEQLVERAEAAGEDDEALARLHEADLARVEVRERVRDVEVGVRPLLVRQLDVEADREPAAFLRAAVRRLHHARRRRR